MSVEIYGRVFQLDFQYYSVWVIGRDLQNCTVRKRDFDLCTRREKIQCTVRREIQNCTVRRGMYDQNARVRDFQNCALEESRVGSTFFAQTSSS